MKYIINSNISEKYLWLLLWFFLPLSIRFSSMAIAFLALLIIVKFIIKPFSISKKQLLSISLFFVLFLLFFLSLLTNYIDFSSFWAELQKKLALVFVPIMYLLSKLPSSEIRKYSVRGLLASMLLSGLALFIKFIYLFPTNSIEDVVYHNFTEPLQLGAIYYSLFLFVIIFLLIDERIEPDLKKYRIYLIPFFFLLMMLAASKLFILATIPFLIWQLFKISKIKSSTKLLILLPIILISLVVIYPVGYRIMELKNTNIDIVKQDSYTNVTQFNGLTLRLVQWKFALEILNEHKAWFSGVGISNKQDLLDQKYISSGMYIGSEKPGDRGFLGYNFHNQYIETLVGIGIPGMILILLIFFKAFVSKQLFSLPVYYILVLFFITESVLDRQVGIVFFSLIFTSFINDPTEKKV